MKLNFIPTLQMEPLSGMAIAGIVAAGANLAGQGVNAAMVGKSNLRSRQFAEESYFRQRADALADWNMQNAYNAPSAQMQRFRDAGLNPHLVYGQMGQGATVRSSEAQPYKAQAPQFDLGSVIGDYLNTKSQLQAFHNSQIIEGKLREETERVKAQTDYLKTLGILANTRSKSIGVQTDTALALRPFQVGSARINLAQQERDYEYSEINQAAKQKIESATYDQIRSNMSLNISRYDLEVLNSASNRAKAAAEIALIKADTALKEAENERSPLVKERLVNEITQVKTGILNGWFESQIKEKENDYLRKYGTKMPGHEVVSMMNTIINKIPVGKGKGFGAGGVKPKTGKYPAYQKTAN